MISYWQETTEIHRDNGLVLITGRYNHKNQHPPGERALGVHWGDFPQSRGVLSPCVIPETTRNAMLSGLLHQAVTNGNTELIDSLRRAIEFFHPSAELSTPPT